MLHTIDRSADTGNIQYTRPAVLTRIEGDGDEAQLWVRIEHRHATFVIEARSALAEGYEPQVGDELLVTGEDFHSCYIIGVLRGTDSATTRSVRTRQGALAKHSHRDGHELLSIEDEQGHLLFEYDATANKSKLYAARGDLSLAAPQGNIELLSGKGIRCKALGGIVIESASATQLRVATDAHQSSIGLTDQAVLLSAPKMGVRADSGDIRIADALFRGERFKAVLERSKLIVGKIETVAIRIIERARNVYREVDELQQTKANRVRTLVEGAYQLKSETTYIESKKNVNIDGERIHLG